MGRGPNPADAELFGEAMVSTLRTACAELSWLLGRGYAEASSLALVGDRHRLRKRQRTAISRSACGDTERDRRRARRQPASAMAGSTLAIDGFNCVIAVEAALSGGVLLRCRDEATRDLASVHGSYRRVDVTAAALERLMAQIALHRPASLVWWLDRPVSNSGRLGAMIEDALLEALGPSGKRTQWSVKLDFDPDQRLRAHDGLVASGDRWVLDGSDAWVDLPAAVIDQLDAPPWMVDLDVDLDVDLNVDLDGRLD